MKDSGLIGTVDIQKIAKEGSKIYQAVKNKYDPKEKGKSLAIDIDTKEVFLGDSSAEALARAHKKYPKKVFYVVKIGFDTAETVAKSYLNR